MNGNVQAFVSREKDYAFTPSAFTARKKFYSYIFNAISLKNVLADQNKCRKRNFLYTVVNIASNISRIRRIAFRLSIPWNVSREIKNLFLIFRSKTINSQSKWQAINKFYGIKTTNTKRCEVYTTFSRMKSWIPKCLPGI